MHDQVHFAPRLGVGLALAGSAALALGLPVLLAWLWRRRTGAAWRAFGLGAAVFVLAQVVLRLPWQVPIGLALSRHYRGHAAVMVAWMVLSAFTAGLFEEVGRWIGYRRWIRDERSVRVGVMYGLGHGGIESILLVGLPVTAAAVVYALAASGAIARVVPAAQLPALYARLATLTPLAASLGGLERVIAVAAHVALSLVVLRGARAGRASWLWVAVALHFALDLGAVLAARFAGPLAAEAVAALLTVGLWAVALRANARRGLDDDPTSPAASIVVAPAHRAGP